MLILNPHMMISCLAYTNEVKDFIEKTPLLLNLQIVRFEASEQSATYIRTACKSRNKVFSHSKNCHLQRRLQFHVPTPKPALKNY